MEAKKLQQLKVVAHPRLDSAKQPWGTHTPQHGQIPPGYPEVRPMEAIIVLLLIVVALAGFDAASLAWGTDSRDQGLIRR
jgi:hypothetical protein